MYGYVLSDPINLIDPSGLSVGSGLAKCGAGAAGMAIGFAGVGQLGPWSAIPIAWGIGMVATGILEVQQGNACPPPPPPPGNPPSPPGNPPGSPPGGGDPDGGVCK